MKNISIIIIAILAIIISSINLYSQDSKNNKKQMAAYYKQGQKYYGLRQFDKAVEPLNKGLKLAQESGDINEQLKFLRFLGFTYFGHTKYDQAVEQFLQIIEVKKKYGSNKPNLILEFHMLATIYFSWGKYDKAVGYYQKTLTIYKNNKNLRSVAMALSSIAMSYQVWAKFEEAEKYTMDALKIHRQLNDKYSMSASHITLGGLYSIWGKFELSIKHFKLALAIYKELDNQHSIASILANIGTTYQRWGQFDKAIEYFQKALESNRKTLELDKKKQNLLGIAQSLKYIGEVYKAWGKYDKAIDYMQEALKIDQKHHQKYPSVLAGRLTDIAMVYDKWGKYAQAVAYLKQSLDTYDKIPSAYKVRAFASVLNLLGMSFYKWNKHDLALENLNRGLSIYKKMNNKWGLAWNYSNLGVVYKGMGNFDKAIPFFDRALFMYKRLKYTSGVSYSLNNLAEINVKQKQYSQALTYYKQALNLDIKINNKMNISRDLNNIGKAYLSWKKYNLAAKNFIKAIELIESIREDIGSDTETKAAFLAQYIDIYKYLIMTLYYSKDYQKAFQYSEQSKSRSFLEELSKSQVYRGFPFNDQDKDLVQKLELISQQIVAVEHKLTKERRNPKAKAATLNQLIQESKTLRNQYQKLEEQLLKKYPKLIKLFKPKILTLKQAKKMIPADTVVLEYNIWEKGDSQVFILTNSKLKVVKLAKKSYASMIVEYRKYLSDPNAQDRRQIAKSLYRFLIQPAQNYIKGKKLLIIPDASLNYLPFETLQNKQGQYLIENHEINYIQSMSVLKNIQQSKDPGAEYPFFALGGAIYEKENRINKKEQEDLKSYLALLETEEQAPAESIDQKSQIAMTLRKSDKITRAANENMDVAMLAIGFGRFKNLPGTLKEVQTLEKLFYKNKNTDHVFIDKTATEETIKSLSQQGKLKKYQYIHFSTHGFLSVEYPNLSSVVLTQDYDKKEDGYLRMGEIVGLQLNAKLVVLSACETGLGKEVKGEGLVGLTRAFMFAGTKNIIVSLWSVADDSTSAFMIDFYKYLKKGHSIKRSLRKVKLDFIKKQRWSHPYFWSPFVHYGSPGSE